MLYPLLWVFKTSIIIISISSFNFVNIYFVYLSVPMVDAYLWLYLPDEFTSLLEYYYIMTSDLIYDLGLSVLYNTNTLEENTSDWFWFLFALNIFPYPVIFILFALVKLNQVPCWQFVVDSYVQIYTRIWSYVLCRVIGVDLFSFFFI